MANQALRVLFVSSECTPWCKTGGLADVSAALPAALRAGGADVRVLLPAYGSMTQHATGDYVEIAARNRFPSARVLSATLPNGVPALLIDCPELYARGGGPYGDDKGIDWPDNALRFAQLSRVAAELSTASSGLPWQPQVVHCNDWQTGLVPAYLHYTAQPHAASVYTVHNISFQGLFPATVTEEIGLPPESFSVDGVEFYGQCSLLKCGLAYADWLTTVSATYALEIQHEEYGMGMQGIASKRRNVLSGILNGIDTETWNPALDPYLARSYDAHTLEFKIKNKRALQARLALPQTDVPLLSMVSRLTDQKGIDLVLEIAERIAALPAQLVILGSGMPQYEAQLTQLAQRHHGRISATIGFDESLAHLIEAGADVFLMPSRYEPCGMNQMYSQRYGTLPIVRATGGLADSVEDYDAASMSGGGFVFQEATAAALLVAIERALAVYKTPARWRTLQRNAMARDFSWDASALQYLQIYRQLCKAQAPG